MGGLGNGRRVGRSPPLMIAALIACILVLGFNYWVSSSRNLELQTKLYELEGQVRRGAAERGAAELKRSEFEEEIKKQKEQIMHIENVYQSKLEEAQDTCSQIKATLQQNISSSTGAIQELKDQLNKLNDDLEKCQNELLSCQGDKETLNNRLTFDITQCQSQVQSQKEQCDERVAAAKLEVQKDMEKLIVPPVAQQENAPEKKDVEEVKTSDDKGNASAVVSHTQAVLNQKAAPVAELLSDDNKDAGASKDQASTKAVDKADHQPVTSAAVKPDVLPPPGGAAETEEGQKEGDKPEDKIANEDKEMEALDGQPEDDADTEEDDPGMEGMLIQGKADEAEVDPKIEEPEEYDADEPVVGGVDLEKQQQQAKNAEKADKEMELEPADYNGDDENEGEFEADKQAELAEV